VTLAAGATPHSSPPAIRPRAQAWAALGPQPGRERPERLGQPRGTRRITCPAQYAFLAEHSRSWDTTRFALRTEESRGGRPPQNPLELGARLGHEAGDNSGIERAVMIWLYQRRRLGAAAPLEACRIWHASGLICATRRDFPNEDSTALMHGIDEAIEAREISRPKLNPVPSNLLKRFHGWLHWPVIVIIAVDWRLYATKCGGRPRNLMVCESGTSTTRPVAVETLGRVLDWHIPIDRSSSRRRHTSWRPPDPARTLNHDHTTCSN
jgi:hypothetical protein